MTHQNIARFHDLTYYEGIMAGLSGLLGCLQFTIFLILLHVKLGTKSFNKRSLHDIGVVQNPYEQAISIIGKTLSSFDEDNLIPCFGFGDGN